MHTFIASKTVGDIVTIIPEADEIFTEYDIDLYLYQYKSLEDVIVEKKLNEYELTKRLIDICIEYNNDSLKVLFANMSSSKLIEYIINHYHSYVVLKLQEASTRIQKVQSACGPSHSNFKSCYNLIYNFQINLENLIKDDEILFKQIKEYESSYKSDTFNSINKLVEEIDVEVELMDSVLKNIKEISRNCRIPREEFTSYWLVVKTLQEIKRCLLEKQYLTKNILLERIKENEIL